MKIQIDKKRTDRTFFVGDKVYLKLQLYFGPYTILEKLRIVAYRLQLPISKHSVLVLMSVINFHRPTSTCRYLNLFLDHRLHKLESIVIPQMLIKWSSWLASMATWEDEHALKLQFSDAPAWGSSCFSRREGCQYPSY